jgi:tetratricopeptide (TPR) repeat protein
MTSENPGADLGVALPAEPQLRQAALALRENRPGAAELVLRQFLVEHPDDVDALKLLAEVALRFDCYSDAEELLQRCIRLAPHYDAARYRYAELLFRLNKAHLAIAQIDQLLKRNPESFECRSLRAIALARIGRCDEAIAVHKTLIERHADRPGVWLNYASDLKGAGRQREAIAIYREAIARFPGLVEAYWSLGNLKTFRFEADDLDAMRAELNRSELSARERCLLHFTLGKAMEDARNFSESFDHYSKANALQRAAVRYDADQTTQLFARIRSTVTSDFVARHAGTGCPAADPIFVLGLPRSGSTLVEQILSSHPAIEATMELSNIAAITDRFDGPYPEVLRELDPDVLLALGEEYLEDTSAFRTLGRPLFIDKMPENFRHIGLIHLMLPNARIVDVRRHPLGCGFSNFRQDFEGDYAFSYDLGDLGRYYRDYVELMAHFDRVLPGKVHRVFYEQLIEDPEAETRRLLAYLGLPFAEACLRFHENSRTIRTASSEQVRQPIFTSAIDQWQNYDEWLDPLKRALGPVLGSYPEVPSFTVPR